MVLSVVFSIPLNHIKSFNYSIALNIKTKRSWVFKTWLQFYAKKKKLHKCYRVTEMLYIFAIGIFAMFFTKHDNKETMHHAHVFPHTNFALKTIFYFQCQALHNVHIMEINKVFVYVRHTCTLVMGSSGMSVLMFLLWSPSTTVGLLFNESTFGPLWKAKSLCNYCDYSEWQSGANLSSLFTSTPPALQGGSPGHTHECAFVLRELVCVCGWSVWTVCGGHSSICQFVQVVKMTTTRTRINTPSIN